MDELKHKVLGFLNKQGAVPKIPSMGFSQETFFQPTSIHNSESSKGFSINSKTVHDELRPDDQDILDSIEDIYFTPTEDFDVSQYILKKLPASLDCDSIIEDFKKLKVQQQQCVSKKVLNLILQQQTSCAIQFKEILELKCQLEEMLKTCKESRFQINQAKTQFISSLGILANYRKRQIFRDLMHLLNTIKMLHSTEDKVHELLNDGNFLAAIILLKECIALSSVYRHFTCIAALTRKLQDTLELTEERLDEALARICYGFDAELYSKIQSAYLKLDKSQIAIDQLNMHFMNAIHNCVFTVIHKYAAAEEDLTSESRLARKQDKQLCQLVSQQDVIPCLIEMCKELWVILSSYYQINCWHSKTEDNMTISNESNTVNSQGDQNETLSPVSVMSEFDDLYTRQYVKQKLENGLNKIWAEVQSKVSVFLFNANLLYYQFEQFLQVLTVVHRLIEVGEEFCNSKSEELQETIRKQSVNYLKNYHNGQLEELRIFFENESWEICPVKNNFEILQLQEFKSLRGVLKNFKNTNQSTNSITSNEDKMSSSQSQDGSSFIGNYFSQFKRNVSPFDINLNETLVDENIHPDFGEFDNNSNDSESDNEELRKDFIDENPHRRSVSTKTKHDARASKFFLTNTTFRVLRQMGKYLQMCRLLRPISYDIFICLTQLFDYYLYSVHSFFTSDLKISSSSLYTIKLNSALKRISEYLTLSENHMYVQTSEQSSDTNSNSSYDQKNEIADQKILKPKLNVIVDISNSENLYGLKTRIVAVECVIFIAQQFEMLQNYLEYLVPPANKDTVTHFYNQTIPVAKDLRKPIYMAVVAQSFDLRHMLLSMSKVDWEIKEVVSQHCSYIDSLLREMQVFSMRLDNISSTIFIPEEVSYSLWENIAHLVTHTLVEGFSKAKKCSNGGRALMQLDFVQLMSKFEYISGLKSMPHKEYVEAYIKAFYLEENQIENFIREHMEYSSKHMFGLISCICLINKKTRQRLFSVIEEMEKNR